MVYIGGGRALTRTVFGHKFYVDARDASLAPHILLDGAWEPWITKVFRETVRPGMRVVDVGANMGWYAVQAADLVGAEGSVISFEANPPLASLVRRNLAVNGFSERATVVAKAVYKETTSLQFGVYRDHLGGGSIYATEGAAENLDDHVTEITVPATSLDAYFAPGTRVDVIRMDAEGAEPFILQGARRVIEENPGIAIFFEFSAPMIASACGSLAVFQGDLAALGFGISRITAEGTLEPCTVEDLPRLAHCDLLLRR